MIFMSVIDTENRKGCFDWSLFLTKPLQRQNLHAGWQRYKCCVVIHFWYALGILIQA